MTVEDRILDISRRLARELGEEREKLSEQRAQYAEQLDTERQRLSAEVEARQRQVHHERCSMGHAKDRINAVLRDSDDEILMLNVGGRVFATRRSTLCQFEGSYLANLFSGRWESSIERDDEGRFFLDFDPAPFRLLLNFLRSTRLDSNVAPCPPPAVSADMEERYRNLAEYLGLTENLSEAQRASDEVRGSLDDAEAKSKPRLGASLLNSASTIITALRTTAVQAANDASAAAAAAANAAERRAAAAAEAAAAAAQAAAAPAAPPAAAPGMPRATPAPGSAPFVVPMAAPAPRTSPVAHSSLAEMGSSSSRAPWDELANGSATNNDMDVGCADGSGASQRWSKKVAHQLAVVDPDDPFRIRIGDTRSLAAAASVRSTRGFQAGKHRWEVIVEACSDWSYVGLVSQTWASTSSPVGRSNNSWGVASNGRAYICHQEGRELQRYSSGSRVVFFVDMDARTVTIAIDDKEFADVFHGLPAPLYPAVSNCRSPARYYLNFLETASSSSRGSY